MTKQMFWVVAMALSALLVTSNGTHALARGGHGGRIGIAHAHRALVHRAPFAANRFHAGSPNIVADPFRFQGDFIRTRGVSRNVGSIVAWPYLWPLDSTPQVLFSGSDAPSIPQVIVVAGSPAEAQPRSAPDPNPDYGYVPGCHAIPGGYHCDAQHRPATEP